MENDLKEMGVPAKYADLMFSVPKHEVRWIGSTDSEADLEGIVPELKDWVEARCDTRTDVEKAAWATLKNKSPAQMTTGYRECGAKHVAKFVFPAFYVDPLFEQVSGSGGIPALKGKLEAGLVTSVLIFENGAYSEKFRAQDIPDHLTQHP